MEYMITSSLNTYYFISTTTTTIISNTYYLFIQQLSWFFDFGLYPYCRPKNTLEAIGLLGPMSSSRRNSPYKSEFGKVTPSVDNTWLGTEKRPPNTN